MKRLILPERRIVKEYKEGDGSIVLGKKHNCHPCTIYGVLKRNNIKVRSLMEANKLSLLNGNRKSYIQEYTKNKMKNKIDYLPQKMNGEFAYILGYTCGDGHISKDSYVVTLYSKDVSHLKKISKLTSHEKVKKGRTCYSLIIGRQKLRDYFKKRGIIGNKSNNLRMINIDDKLVNHFLRGVFDADGCVWKARKRPMVNIASGSRLFLEDIKKRINKLFSLKFGLYNKKDHFSLELSGKDKVRTFMKMLYKNADVYLERKYDKFNDVLAED